VTLTISGFSHSLGPISPVPKPSATDRYFAQSGPGRLISEGGDADEGPRLAGLERKANVKGIDDRDRLALCPFVMV
jgi:hypothetical protein